MTDRDVIATLGLAIIGTVQVLARPDKLLHGRGWNDDKTPAAWLADRAEAERIARIWAARREAQR